MSAVPDELGGLAPGRESARTVAKRLFQEGGLDGYAPVLVDNHSMHKVQDIDRGGKWRETHAPASDLSGRTAKLADLLQQFLVWHSEVGGNIWYNFRSFVLQKNLSEPEVLRFKGLLEMYIHKYMRHLQKVDED